MKGLILFLIAFVLSSNLQAQEGLEASDSLSHYESPAVPIYTAEYMRKYNRAKRLVKEVYPYALYAADVLDKINNNAEEIEKRRKVNRFYRKSYRKLKKDFKYVILDMYTSEGRMLMKLVHRETGMTVYEIASKYKGDVNAKIFSLMGKMWDQDLKSEYDPEGTDKITEHVIKDIQKGSVEFEKGAEIIEKNEYKELKKEHRKKVRKNKKRRRKLKRKRRREARKKKKQKKD